ncbi:hypothetical protein [Desulfosporosinus sp. OT]|uniref:hypothetical protein n=1 Tax=Desulfosporosinus sp. OT TaxID=913865 RepID=UPI0002239C99|nr:hypothetical protein [Desulfosporosinus sp. OT]EGW40147.1 hypothetical protein DOT_1948 [Desulfosporosinus sp. OT]
MTTIIAKQGTLDTDLKNLGDQFDQMLNKQDTTNNTLDSINSTLEDLSDYITTPRSASSLSTSSLGSVPTFDPTVPFIPGEPDRDPYNGFIPVPQLPPYIDSPSPLPAMPDPSTLVMPHDNPKPSNSPVPITAPLTPQTPARSQNPLPPQSPVTQQTPLTTSPVAMDPPLTKSPVAMDAPLEPSTVQRSTPIAPQTPISPNQPYTMQEPIPPQ